jgi:hypothetical protein
MSKVHTEPEETGGEKYNPLNQKVNEKAYTGLNITVDPEKLNNPISEPAFTPPPAGNNISGNRDDGKASKTQTPPPGATAQSGAAAPVNPELTPLPPKDVKDAAKKASKMILDGYSMLNDFVGKKVLFDTGKLRKMQIEGEIDLNIQIPISETEIATAGEIVVDYNEQNKDAFTVTDEFKAEVLPPLQRVLEKRGIGMTDEQFLVYAFGKDIAMKGFTFFALRTTMNEILETLRELKKEKQEFRPITVEERFAQEPFVPDSFEQEEVIITPPPTPMTANDIVNSMTDPEGYAARHAANQQAQLQQEQKPRRGRKPKKIQPKK